jgi:hypothetical protein
MKAETCGKYHKTLDVWLPIHLALSLLQRPYSTKDFDEKDRNSLE